MAPRYLLDADVSAGDDLQSTSPHWVVGFARYANPITYSPTRRASVTSDPSYSYAERPVLVVDDQGDAVSVTVSASKSSHVSTMQVSLLDSGTPYLNEVLPGDWVVACVAYDLDDARALAADMRAGRRVNGWERGLKFVGQVKSVQKRVAVNDAGVPQAAYSVSCSAGDPFDGTILYYPQLTYSDSIPASLDKFGPEVSEMIRGHESNEFGALDINRVVPKLVGVIFGRGAWAGQEFRGEPLTPNLAYIVPKTICRWLGAGGGRSTYADLLRVLLGVQKHSSSANWTSRTTSPGKLFWPDGAQLRDGAFHCPFDLLGSFPAEVVPQTTTTPWAFITNYVNQPINEPTVNLRPDQDGYVYPFFTVRQLPYTSEVGRDFDLGTFQADVQAQRDANSGRGSANPAPASVSQLAGVGLGQGDRAATFTRVPTTRFLELPRWVASTKLVKEAAIGRHDGQRQNLVFVFGSGAGVGPNEQDQFVNAGPVKDDLDIYRNGVRPYMPSVNCFLRDVVLLPADWRDIMADVVMGQHLVLNGTVTITGVRAPIAPGDNFELEGVVYHVESVTHSCSVSSDGRRDFTTRLALSRGVAAVAATREEEFPNLRPTDPEGPPIEVTRD